MIAITAKPAKGFHRCGVHHPAQRTLHHDDRFTDEQVEVLLSEPMLAVELNVVGPDEAEDPEDLDELLRRRAAKAAEDGEGGPDKPPGDSKPPAGEPGAGNP